MKTTTARARNRGGLGRARGRGNGGPWISRTGLRLALAIVGIALASIGTIVGIAGATIATDVNRLVGQQGTDLTRALALASAAAYGPAGWDREDLDPVLDLVAQAGAAAQVQGHSGRLIATSPDFGRLPAGHAHRAPIAVRGRAVGSVTVKFDHRGLAAAIDRYETLRWHVRIAAIAAAAVIAVAISLIVSRTLTAPVDRLIAAARAMGAGDGAARVGRVKGIKEVRELSAAFDQMADSIAGEARQRRDMAADLAHELRAPITVLQAGLESMQDGVTAPTPENMASLRDEVVRLAQMADDLPVLASGQVAGALRLNLHWHDLAAIAAEAADSLAGSFAAADIELILRLSPVDIMCDARRIHEVTVNLLGNAVKFTPAGRRVVVETGPSSRSGNLAVLRVSDTGIGIPPDELPHVSQRFFRGRQAADIPGSGIGLAIVEQLALVHHGSIDIVSEPGSGTKVTVTLPRVAD